MTHDLRARCSRYFTFADLIECGETWRARREAGEPIANVPLRDDTFEGIASLAREILDPLQERFGVVTLTYAFAGPSLTRCIPGRIAPALDQHAGSELNVRGRIVCARRGQSCDLRVPGLGAFEVGQWIREHLEFDRMYIYGAANALHVSCGPAPSGSVYALVPRGERRVPREVTRRGWDEIAELLGGS